MYHTTLRCIRLSIVAMENQQVLYSMSVCVSEFLPYLYGLQIAHFLCCIIVSCVAFLAAPYFATLKEKIY